jgi:hypothetical protein
MQKHHKIPSKALVSLLLFTLLFNPALVSAAVSDWQQGGSINATTSGDFSSESFRQSLRDLVAIGANYATLIIPYYQSNIYSTDIQRGWNTPTDESLVSATQYAHSLGLKVMFKIHIDTYDYQWRANINPSDRATWFNKYEAMLVHYANLAKNNGVEEFCIGAETISMTSEGMNSSNTFYWNRMIASVRNIYSGKLTYSSQRTEGGPGHAFDEQYGIKFWDKLDYLGISGYFPIATWTNNPTKQEVINAWSTIEQTKILPFQQMYNKPVIFTEIGYRSLYGANREPWEYNRQDTPSSQVQSALYDGLMEFWNNKSYFQGIHMWDWESNPNAGGENTTSFTPQNKSTEEILAKWFKDGSPVPNPGVPASVTITGDVSPVPSYVNEQLQLKTTIKTTTNISNAIVDIEVYNSNDQKIHQHFLSNQNLVAGADNNFTANWTPNATGQYKLKVGVFNSNWSQVYKWEANAKTFSVENKQVVQPPVNATYTVGASLSSSDVKTNQNVTVTGSVKASTVVSNAIVDIEIYNSNDQRVFQKFFTNQNLPANTSVNFPVDFSTVNAGTYTIKIGVFNQSWNNLYWNGDVKKFDVTAPAVVVPVENTLVVINPTNNASLKGVVSFKAKMSSSALNTYNMFWRVDTGQLNQMNNSGDAKEALVDLSGWNWKQSGPYAITFVAKDLGGNVLKEQTVNITIAP